MDRQAKRTSTPACLPVFAAVWACVLCLASCRDSGGGGSAQAEPSSGLRRGPQIAQVTETSVVIAWSSFQLASASIEYGPDPANPSTLVESPSSSQRRHVFTLSGLTPGTLYHYRILLDGEILSAGHTFATADAGLTAPVRFAVFGDSGSGTLAQQEIAREVLAATPDLVLITGDVIYESGANHELDPRYFSPYRDLLDHIPFYPSLGNHDVLTDNGRPLLDALYLPENDEVGDERYYSFDRGPIHFIALDSNQSTDPASAQIAWLRRDLEAAMMMSAWKIVYFHYSIYSSSLHGGDPVLRSNLIPIFDKYAVDIVFNGHDHDYERSFPMREDVPREIAQDPDYVSPSGTIYVVTGGGGRTLYANGAGPFTAFSASLHHFVLVEIEGTELRLEAILADGSVLDAIRITK